MSKCFKAITAAFLSAFIVAGCGSAAPSLPPPPAEPSAESTRKDSLLVVKRDEGSPAPNLAGNVSDGPTEDLVTLTTEEEMSFALFCPMLSETQFRDMLLKDGADFVPNRLAHFENRYFAYYNSGRQELVVCDAALRWFRNIVTSERPEDRVQDARWLNENELLVLTGSEHGQKLYTYLMTEQELRPVYEPPQNKVILSLRVTETGEVECVIGELPEPPDGEAEPLSEPAASLETKEDPADRQPVEESPIKHKNPFFSAGKLGAAEDRTWESLFPEDWPRETIRVDFAK